MGGGIPDPMPPNASLPKGPFPDGPFPDEPLPKGPLPNSPFPDGRFSEGALLEPASLTPAFPESESVLTPVPPNASLPEAERLAGLIAGRFRARGNRMTKRHEEESDSVEAPVSPEISASVALASDNS
jgi:hypothetical protein